MDTLDLLKSQWAAQNGATDHTLIDEYGVALASWALEHLDDQPSLEAVLTSHLLCNDALLDHCGWEMIPILYRREWMQTSAIVDELFAKIPPREVVLHSTTAFGDLEETWKAQCVQRCLRLLPRLLMLDSKRPVQDILNLLAKCLPIRHVTPPNETTIVQGTIYGLTSQEDTSEAGQRVSPSYKASLALFVPPALSLLEAIISENLNTILSSASATNLLLSALFLLAHSISSFRPLLADSTQDLHPTPAPPVLNAPHRPKLRRDTDLDFLVEASSRTAALVTLLGVSSLDLLNHWNIVSAHRIRNEPSDAFDDLSTNIRAPKAVTDQKAEFDATGVAACLFDVMQNCDGVPIPWLILSQNALAELLLQHAREVFTSRCLFAPEFLQRALSYTPSLISACDIDYPIAYILEHQILPSTIPHKAYATIRACVEFGIRMPDTDLRQASYASIMATANLFNGNGKYKLLYMLIKTCPYPTAQGLFIHLMKDAFLCAHSEALRLLEEDEAHKTPLAGSDHDTVSTSSTAPTTPSSRPSNSILLSADLFQDFFARTCFIVNGLEQRYDLVFAGLNFLRAILLRDAKSKISDIWKTEVLAHFKKTTIDQLETAVLQIIARHQNDDSYDDRKRIQKELSTKGMGDMSVDQLQSTQTQTILNWQLAHSIILRIQELFA